MAEQSSIEWTDATWNPITGCTLVSEGCRHCYAATLAATRLKHHPSREGLARKNSLGEAKFTGEVRLNEQWVDQPLRWKRPRMIFVCAHGDLFHEAVPDEWIDRVFAVMALAPHHTFQVLTKRPERAARYFVRDADDGFMPAEARIEHRAKQMAAIPVGKTLVGTMPWPHVWLGTSVEDQATADARIPHLLHTPAAVRFVSAEPLLGPLDLTRGVIGTSRSPLLGGNSEGSGSLTDWAGLPRLDWVIVGGESGTNARPMHPDWARSLREQCQAAGVAFFFKQWGEWLPAMQSSTGTVLNGRHGVLDASGGFALDHDLAPGSGQTFMIRLGKKRAGRLLDGRTWNGIPEAAR